jgi:phosphoribosylamine--glycine ligase
MRRAQERCEQGSVVIKADGLAAGKGVYVCPTAEEAHRALREVTGGRFGEAAKRLVLEELLDGPEVSVFALCDGERVVALPSAQDHKRLGNGNTGPNTGGMGAYAPCPLVGAVDAAKLVERVHLPVIQEMARRGTPFRGGLYAGLMLTAAGPKVLEFNVRFGDPECQPLMRLWEDDPLPWLHGVAVGALPVGGPVFSAAAACCVVLASAGYPLSSDKGRVIPESEPPGDVVVFHAATQRGSDGALRTNGGRVLGITAMAPSISAARERCYAVLPEWTFWGAQYRTDIAVSIR